MRDRVWAQNLLLRTSVTALLVACGSGSDKSATGPVSQLSPQQFAISCKQAGDFSACIGKKVVWDATVEVISSPREVRAKVSDEITVDIRFRDELDPATIGRNKGKFRFAGTILGEGWLYDDVGEAELVQ